MSKYLEKNKAREMRKMGESLGAISTKLGVSKSTVSLWCRDILLGLDQVNFLTEKVTKAGLAGRMKGAEMNRKKKEKNVNDQREQARKKMGKISQRDLMMIGTSLYWGEGSKNGSRTIFVNSDPEMIRIMYKFFREVHGVSKELFKPTVQINEIHKPRINKVLKFWSFLLDLPLNQFGNTYYVKTTPKKVYGNYESYYGILRLVVNKGSNLQYEILGSIDVIKKI
ncbi:MAG: hypothetical protein A2370_01400 [Candidatus Vogelbacteria bacterium RIFOXYB1_FULL_42_16]|uniref:Uncharacterized protein n=2 Tax=Candidatus Vogeliibacteriota TaxID=1817922 RepID=A0A1G2QEE4_9BACT|nr:MAG: hypothetical protein A2607_00960 [Candidatus Vogelbacteria bacterium RIFOXYD1_FULL_42_15]OHA58352.1 MAG: hypothetical protein A2370_01400 [Candidatus Vogelbacteria bacterium RIFOXYB1_FULL_42_16]